MVANGQRPERGWRHWLHTIIFEAETPAGKAFDVCLIVAIVASVVTVTLESVASLRDQYGDTFRALEWGFTILFTVEYVLRLISVRRPLLYATSFFGVIDLLAIVPTYLSLMLPGAQSLAVVRILRLLRIFRILKLTHYVGEARILMIALRASRRKVMVFLLTVFTIVIVVGAAMYVVEGEEHGFSNIPRSIYWAIVTMTTVGFGDMVPKTPFGQTLASALMITGYSIIAIPTGIFTAEMAGALRKREVSTQACPACGSQGHDPDAVYCKYCAAKLEE